MILKWPIFVSGSREKSIRFLAFKDLSEREEVIMVIHASFLRQWLFIVLALGITGCARTYFHANVNKDTNGIRYYLPATYILIKPDYTKGEANVTYWTGPDTTTLYAADPFAFAASNTSKFVYERGYLTSASSIVDPTKVASEAISALDDLAKGILTTAAKGAQLAALRAKREGPQIWLFIVGRDGKLRTLYSPKIGNDLIKEDRNKAAQ